MKLGARRWCKIQETLANLKCPNCFRARVKLTGDKKKNAVCEECGCKFEFDPDVTGLAD